MSLSNFTNSLGNKVVATAVLVGVLMLFVFLVKAAYSGGTRADGRIEVQICIFEFVFVTNLKFVFVTRYKFVHAGGRIEVQILKITLSVIFYKVNALGH